MIVSRTFMDPNIFYIVFFFILVFLYERMTGSKRRERGDESISSDKRPRNLTETEGETTSSDKRPRNLTEREDETTSSDKRPRREAMGVVEGTYIFLLLFKKRINISYWIGD